MAAQGVDDEGNLWFFSGLDSDKNKEIKQDNHVQLFFSDPSKSSYLVVNGEAHEVIDQEKFEKYWSPLVKTWFKEGKEDPNLSLIKVVPTNSYYWDVDGNRMINFLKMIASVHFLYHQKILKMRNCLEKISHFSVNYFPKKCSSHFL